MSPNKNSGKITVTPSNVSHKLLGNSLCQTF
jgi:hypothetical protein